MWCGIVQSPLLELRDDFPAALFPADVRKTAGPFGSLQLFLQTERAKMLLRLSALWVIFFLASHSPATEGACGGGVCGSWKDGPETFNNGQSKIQGRCLVRCLEQVSGSFSTLFERLLCSYCMLPAGSRSKWNGELKNLSSKW